MTILILSFFVYAIAGWLWESIILPIIKREPFYNSGFLDGPIVPIYGVGATLVEWLFGRSSHSFIELLLFCGIATCILEYFTSVIMETLFHHKWWDYSTRPFNFKGRICLEGFVVFGLFGALVVQYIQPYIETWLLKMPTAVATITAITLAGILVIDIITTTVDAKDLDRHIQNIRAVLETELDKMKTRSEELQTLRNIISNRDELRKRQKRLLKAYPYLTRRHTRKQRIRNKNKKR